MFDHMQKTLTDVRYPDEQNPGHIIHTFRKIFGRAQIDDREVRILHGLWSRIDWIEGRRRKYED
jgi:tRNA/rRNA methyltransferase